jgi:hypothetical protein
MAGNLEKLFRLCELAHIKANNRMGLCGCGADSECYQREFDSLCDPFDYKCSTFDTVRNCRKAERFDSFRVPRIVSSPSKRRIGNSECTDSRGEALAESLRSEDPIHPTSVPQHGLETSSHSGKGRAQNAARC